MQIEPRSNADIEHATSGAIPSIARIARQRMNERDQLGDDTRKCRCRHARFERHDGLAVFVLFVAKNGDAVAEASHERFAIEWTEEIDVDIEKLRQIHSFCTGILADEAAIKVHLERRRQEGGAETRTRRRRWSW